MSSVKTESDAMRMGPPWMGPLVPRAQYDREWLLVYVIMLASAGVFFGWRGVFHVSVTALAALVVFPLVSVPLHAVRGHWGQTRLIHVLNMGLLVGLSLPLTPTVWLGVRAGIAAGILSYVMGPARRLRIHPVAAAQVLIVLPIALMSADPIGIGAVLTPGHVIVGDVGRMERAPEGTAFWLHTPTLTASDGGEAHALIRRDPSVVIATQQQSVLASRPRLPQLLREGELVRLIDVVIGGRPGPLGASSAGLMIVLGLWLVHRRLSRWPMLLAAVAGGVLMLTVLPVQARGSWSPSMMCFADIGWHVTLAYIGYQLLATPLLPLAMVLAPMTMPRSSRGRVLYGLIVGGGIIAVRWFLPYEGAAFVPIVIAGLSAPMLDRLRRSRFVDAAPA